MRIVRYSYPNTRSFIPAASTFRQSPWSGLEGEIDRLFESALGSFVGSSATDRFPVDVLEDKDNAYVRAELPGVNRADLGVEVVDGYLNINATRKTKSGENEETFSLNRSVALPGKRERRQGVRRLRERRADRDAAQERRGETEEDRSHRQLSRRRFTHPSSYSETENTFTLIRRNQRCPS